MRYAIGISYAILFAIALLVASACVESIPITLERYRIEREDFYLNAFWLCVSLGLGAFWFRGMLRAFRSTPPRVGAGTYIAGALVGVSGLLVAALGATDPLDAPILVPGGLTAAVSAAGFIWLARANARAA